MKWPLPQPQMLPLPFPLLFVVPLTFRLTLILPNFHPPGVSMIFARWLFLSLAIQAHGSPVDYAPDDTPFHDAQPLPATSQLNIPNGLGRNVLRLEFPRYSPPNVPQDGKGLQRSVQDRNAMEVSRVEIKPAPPQDPVVPPPPPTNPVEPTNIPHAELPSKLQNAQLATTKDLPPVPIDFFGLNNNATDVLPVSSSMGVANIPPVDPRDLFHPVEQSNLDVIDICKSYALEPSQANYFLSRTDDWLKMYALENSKRPYYRQHGLMATIAFDHLGINNFKCSIGTEHLCRIDCPTVVNRVQDLDLARKVFFALSSGSNFLTMSSIIHSSMEGAQNNIGLMAQKMSYDYNWWRPSEEERKRELAFQFWVSAIIWGAQTVANTYLPMIPWSKMQEFVGKKATKYLDKWDARKNPDKSDDLSSPRSGKIWDTISSVLRFEGTRDPTEPQPGVEALSPPQQIRWIDWAREKYAQSVASSDETVTPRKYLADSGLKLRRRSDTEDLSIMKRSPIASPQSCCCAPQPEIAQPAFEAPEIMQPPEVVELPDVAPIPDAAAIPDTAPGPEVVQAPDVAQALDAVQTPGVEQASAVEPPENMQPGADTGHGTHCHNSIKPEEIVRDVWGPGVESIFNGPGNVGKTRANAIEPPKALVENRFAELSKKIDRARARLKLFMPVGTGLMLPLAIRELINKHTWRGTEGSRDGHAANLAVMISQAGQASRRFLKDRINGLYLDPRVNEDGSTELIDALALGSFVSADRDTLGHWTDANVETALTKNLFMRTLNVSWKTQRIFIMCTEDFQNKKDPNTQFNHKTKKVEHWEHDNTGPQASKTKVGNEVCYAYRWADRSSRFGHHVEDPYGIDTFSGEPWNIKISDIITSSVLASQLPPGTDLEMLSNSARLSMGPTADFINDPTTPGMFNLPVCHTAWNWNGPTTGTSLSNTEMKIHSGSKILPCYCGPLGADTAKIWEQLRLDSSGRKTHYYKARCPRQVAAKIHNPLERYVALCRLGVRNQGAGRAWKYGKDKFCDVVISELESKGIKVVERDMTDEQVLGFMCKLENWFVNQDCWRFRRTPVDRVWEEAEELEKLTRNERKAARGAEPLKDFFGIH